MLPPWRRPQRQEAIRLKVFGSPTYMFEGQTLLSDRIVSTFLEGALEAACSSA